MLYLNEDDLLALGADWGKLADTVTDALASMAAGDYVQPLKPYLRFKDPANRIIAMPAYIGGTFDAAGIKWIASFPANPSIGIPRAHSVVVLNDAATGKPVALVNSPLLSIMRTAAVSAVMLRRWLELPNQHHNRPLNVGLIGCGPIGQWHARMLTVILGSRLGKLKTYDLSPARARQAADAAGSAGSAAASWEEAYFESDIIVTCTVSGSRYIFSPPPRGSLLLHVSLRDYRPSALASINTVVVDDWDEICRENTDIEQMHLTVGWEKDRTITLSEAVFGDKLLSMPKDGRLLFSPMGMAIFDIAVATYTLGLARDKGIGLELK
ncbi:ornithine cyclodeaminase [Paenibacillus cellulosilyticus]|uniref:Ornithine cyclodeaminase n=1 Tax=Paenibacillus cellulosilyticus TaxID=375489 RepID=A0A2V2YGW4_9BACL|nr:2,3-diaminopropionate biosynthesis protein SbnB [Paenibacillus cellulosilyticus]PWV92045.1 ornithine cyclodeaminase [Paenibacillus cellulosilyticus]QKS46727.1 2,3-diaminopropionate biosynthesis protein SbnB [Paenibacillus cellulosilyticus]